MGELNPEDTTRIAREEVRKEAERAAAEAAGNTTEHPSLTSYLARPREGTRTPPRPSGT